MGGAGVSLSSISSISIESLLAILGNTTDEQDNDDPMLDRANVLGSPLKDRVLTGPSLVPIETSIKLSLETNNPLKLLQMYLPQISHNLGGFDLISSFLPDKGGNEWFRFRGKSELISRNNLRCPKSRVLIVVPLKLAEFGVEYVLECRL